jgi:hypothetical protein
VAVINQLYIGSVNLPADDQIFGHNSQLLAACSPFIASGILVPTPRQRNVAAAGGGAQRKGVRQLWELEQRVKTPRMAASGQLDQPH